MGDPLKPYDGAARDILSPMLTSVKWLNRYLDPADVTAEVAEHVLTHAGFPIESAEPLPGGGGDTRLDVELTSNRGDCLCHLGLAREIAAAGGRRLKVPQRALPKAGGPAPVVAGVTRVEHHVGAACPRFTARVITGVKVGPSPAWLREALESVGQRSINNVVDVTNYALLELGHPSHVFDMATLAGRRLVVRQAREGESVPGLDGKTHKLVATDMVVADAERAQSIAGVVGGVPTGVTERTTDVLLEVATWDPATVRRTARRLDVRTDASHRFERYVDARDVAWASAHIAALILEVAGGTLCEGMIDVGPQGAFKAQPPTVITLRLSRCEHLLGVRVPTPEVVRLLTAVGVEVLGFEKGAGDGSGDEVLRCQAPNHRHDLTREVDLIEEVARLHGLDKLTPTRAIGVNLDMRHPAQWSQRERATAAIGRTLTGMGFYETVTFSFATKADAELWLPSGLRALKVDEERRRDTPYLRPSILPSLLHCRKANRDAQVRVEGGVRLFELASVYAEEDDGAAFGRKTVENRNLAILMDVQGCDSPSVSADQLQQASRAMRGVIERVVDTAGGPAAKLEFAAHAPIVRALEGAPFALVTLNGTPLGYLGFIAGKACERWGVDAPVAVAELGLAPLIALYPPAARAHALPGFPTIERDLSVVVDEQVTWESLSRVIVEADPRLLEQHQFVGTYRGKPIAKGRKSVTMRLVFRDLSRTLRHEEVDPQVALVVERLRERAGAELRA